MTENDLRLHGQPSNASFNNRDRAVERIPLDQRSQEVTALFQEVIISAHVRTGHSSAATDIKSCSCWWLL